MSNRHPWDNTTPSISSEDDSRYETPNGAQNKVNISQEYLLQLLKLAVTGLSNGSEAAIARYSTPYDITYDWLKDRLDFTDMQLDGLGINVMRFGAKGDGIVDDTVAIQAAINYASLVRGTVYFPNRRFKVTAQLNVQDSFICINGAGGITGQAVIESYLTTGDLFHVTSGYQVKISNIEINIMNNVGSAVKFVTGAGHELRDCIIRGRNGNGNPVVYFASGTTIIKGNKFVSADPESYCVVCRAIPSQVNINSYINDNSFGGEGKGVLVDAINNSTRPEGLKICNNVFINTGSEQINVKTILHVDISNNMMDQSSNFGILVVPNGLGVNGLYINENYISPAQALTEGIAIKFEDTSSGAVNSVITKNMIAYTGYGIIGADNVYHITINANNFMDINHDCISLNQSQNVIINSNQMTDTENYSLVLTDGVNGGPFIVSDNIVKGAHIFTTTTPEKFIVHDNYGI